MIKKNTIKFRKFIETNLKSYLFFGRRREEKWGRVTLKD
jgi:hypothetical protein